MKAAIILVIAAVMAAVATAALTQEQTQFLFTRFVQNYDKSYETAEMFQRFAIFQTNLEFIIQSNANPAHTFKMGVNQFTDMTEAEFKKTLGFRAPSAEKSWDEAVEAMGSINLLSSIPDAADLSKYAGAVKNQGSCGSCWAFSATSIVEIGFEIATGSHAVLSEQQMVDCDSDCDACDGCLPEPALNWAKSGMCLDKDYPYTSGSSGRAGSCKKCDAVAKVTKVELVSSSNTCANHKAAIANNQAVSMGIAAGNRYFQGYSSGILNVCPEKQLDHAVVAIGYGTENGVDFIRIRNSWGQWGESGYIRVAANGNICGACTQAYDRKATVVKA